MNRSAAAGRVLVWMRDHRLARQLCAAFERRGVEAVWAAALPEAIAALDREFPAAIACTLTGTSPSLIDLETVVAYQALGHAAVSLSPPPVWALTDDARRYASEIGDLGLAVQLIPREIGREEVVARVMDHVQGAGRPAIPGEGPVPVILFERPAEAAFLARHLCARGVWARSAETPVIALAALAQRSPALLVCEDYTLRRGAGTELWGWLAGPGRDTRVILIGTDAEWLTHVSPLGLPHNVVCMLSKPIQARALEATLRRLLRIAAQEPCLTAARHGALLQG
ncbi:MAG: hypothetical protein V1774_08140 [Candidatus Eisenbacteria bacterium]